MIKCYKNYFMSLTDLKSFRSKSHPWGKIPWGLSGVFRKSHLLSSDGISSSPCLSPVRGSLQRQLQSQGVHLSRSVLLHGLCPDHVSGESTRYRSLPSGTAWQALPHGNQGTGFQKYPGQRQQGQGLAHLCGPCALADCHGPQALQQRSVSRRPERDCLRSGRHNYRFMPALVPLGAFPKDERSYQAPYPVGSARQYPVLHPHLRWETPRGQHSGYHSHRGRRFLYHGRGYLDYGRLHCLSQAAAFFVTGAKSNLKCRRVYSHPVDRSTGLICEQSVLLTVPKASTDYPDKLRRVKYYDSDTKKTLVFLTNNFTLPSLTICTLYRSRWQVELFFKWIKQNLRIKTFYGTSENAVKTQIWIAVSVYVLVAIMKKQLNIRASLYTILQVLSVSVFERTLLFQLLAQLDDKSQKTEIDNQLDLFN